MYPHMLALRSDATTISKSSDVSAARELARHSITALAAHTLKTLLRFRSAAHRYRLMVVFSLLGVALTAVSAIAQTPESAVEDWDSVLTTEAGLVVIPLHVYKNGKSVGGLGEQAFELVEDGVVQNIAFVDGPGGRGDPAEGRTAPIEIILLVDVQHSVRIDLLDTRKLRDRFFEGIKETVAISVYGFADKLQRFLGPTRDIAKVQLALEMAYSSGDGHIPIVDAIVATARDAASRTENASRKLVVFSSGLNYDIFGKAAHSALDYEIAMYQLAERHQEPPDGWSEPTTGLSAAYFPFWLGRPGPDAKGWPQERPANRNQKRRSVPLQECCPLGMETIRTISQMGLKGYSRGRWLRTDSDPEWKYDKSMFVRAYLKSLAKVAQNEYFVGYYPSRTGDEPIAREVEVRLKSKRIGQLYGSRRVIVY